MSSTRVLWRDRDPKALLQADSVSAARQAGWRARHKAEPTAEDRARALAVETRALKHADRVLLVGLARRMHLPVVPILRAWADFDHAEAR